MNETQSLNEKQSATRAFLALLGGVLAIAWSAIFVRWAPIPGPASAFYRVAIATLLFWPYVFVSQRRHSAVSRPTRISKQSFWLAALGGLFFAGDLAAYNTAVLRTTAANAVLLGNNAPLFVGLFTLVFWKRAPRPVFWIGLAISMSGSLLIVGLDTMHARQSASTTFSTGDLLAILASVFFAGYLMITEKVRNDVGVTLLLAMSLVSSTVCLGLFDLALGISLHVPGLRIWAALAGMAAVSQVVGYFLLTYALGHLPATITSVTLLAQAPIAALLAYVLLRERYGWAQIACALLVLTGIGIVNLGRTQPVLISGE